MLKLRPLNIVKPQTLSGHEIRTHKTIHPKALPHPLFLSLPFLFLYQLFSPRQQQQHHDSVTTSKDLRIRPGYSSYESYIQRQLNKTLNPRLRRIWTSSDWERKIPVRFFEDLRDKKLIENTSKALCIGAQVGQEVEALRRIGVAYSVGMVKGDFHNQPFQDDTFDFEFSNPERLVEEIERTLKPAGVLVLHVAISPRADKYSALFFGSPSDC